METRDLQSRQAVLGDVGEWFERLRPYQHRFFLAASCNKAFSASWDTLPHRRME